MNRCERFCPDDGFGSFVERRWEEATEQLRLRAEFSIWMKVSVRWGWRPAAVQSIQSEAASLYQNISKFRGRLRPQTLLWVTWSTFLLEAALQSHLYSTQTVQYIMTFDPEMVAVTDLRPFVWDPLRHRMRFHCLSWRSATVYAKLTQHLPTLCSSQQICPISKPNIWGKRSLLFWFGRRHCFRCMYNMIEDGGLYCHHMHAKRT